MSEAARSIREAVVTTVLKGPGVSTAAARQAAFDNDGVDPRASALVDKVSRCAWTVTDRDVAAVKASGVSEDEIFELTVAAALGQATRQLQTALTAVAAVDAPPTSIAAGPQRGGSR